MPRVFHSMIRFVAAFAAAGFVFPCIEAVAFSTADLQVPDGFSVTIYADDVPNARQMALGASGTLFVGSRSAGRVYAVIDADGDLRAERVIVIAEDLFMPSGVAFRDGSLFVAEVHRVLRFDRIEQQLKNPPAPVVVSDVLPAREHHGWKFIAFGPDGRLYVPVGAPCNVCEVEAPFGTILRMQADGSELEVFASGIRNSVGFDWHPRTGALWFSDNGRDWLGDDSPPCELNHAPRPGMHFGFPYVHGGDIRDPEFGAGRDPASFTPPARRLGAHVAPLGIEFYRGAQFPAEYKGALFVAEHGSWNRSRKSGYRVMVARLAEDGSVAAYTPFITGWLRGQAHSGRPVDFETLPDGSMLVSDDHRGAIYRVTWDAP